MTNHPMNSPKHEPTPEEIKEACRLYQAGWSDHEKLGRMGTNANPPVKVTEAGKISSGHRKLRSSELPQSKG